MTAVAAKQSTIGGGIEIPTSQLTPNFFNSIFNDGMNPFDECFGSSASGINSSLLASTLRKEHAAFGVEKPRVLKDEALPTINTKLEQTLTPEHSPKSSITADASLPTQLTLSRGPSPFHFTNAFPDSPVSPITPITSPEDLTPNSTLTKEQSKAVLSTQAANHKTRKSFSGPKVTKTTARKRTLSPPQDWNPAFKVAPDASMPTTVQSQKQRLSRGVECQAKPPSRPRARFADAPVPHLVSRMDGIFVTESIPSSEIKAEPNSPTQVGFRSTSLNAGRKRKQSSIDFDDEEDDDEETAGLNEAEKRARFLERNRIAASKCRKKKKLMNQRLEEKSRLLVQQNRFLSATLAKLRSEVLRLKQLVLIHHDCKHPPIERYLHQEAGKYLANDCDDFPRKLQEDSQSDLEIIKAEEPRVPTWLNEFHSFQEVESEALKRSAQVLEFDEEDFQKLLLGEQLAMMDEDFRTSPPCFD